MNTLLLIIVTLAICGLVMFVAGQLFICYLDEVYNRNLNDHEQE